MRQKLSSSYHRYDDKTEKYTNYYITFIFSWDILLELQLIFKFMVTPLIAARGDDLSLSIGYS